MRTRLVILVAAILALAGCSDPALRDSEAIVGAELLDANGRTVHAHCLVVIKGGKLVTVGSQQLTPLPKTAFVIDGLNHYLAGSRRPEGPAALSDLVTLTEGQPATLVLLRQDPRRDPGAFARPVRVVRVQ